MKLGNAQIVKLRFLADPIKYIAQPIVGRELRKQKINSQLSPTKRRENTEFFDRALRLAEELYKTIPSQRLGVMKDLIDYARTG